MNRTLTTTLLFVLAGAGLGCSPPAKKDSGTCTVDTSWGHMDTGTFAAFQSGESAEITLGFQGFRFIRSAMRVAGTDADSATFSFQITVEGREPFVQDGSLVPISEGTDGARYADEVLVFFNDIPAVELIGRTADVIAFANAGGCTGSFAVDVVLVDDDNCIDLGDGGLDCGDAGISDSGM